MPLSVVLLFDLTDSVRPVLKSLGEGVLEALQHLKPEDEVTVMTYAASRKYCRRRLRTANWRWRQSKRPAAWRVKKRRSLTKVFSRRRRSWLKASTRSSRRVIIWLTDNVPNVPSEDSVPLRYRRSLNGGMPYTQAEAVQHLLRTNTVVCSLVKQSDLSVSEESGLMSKPAERMLHPPGEVYKYAGVSGGQVIEFKKKELKEKLALLIDDLRMRYTLGYHPSTQKPKGKYCAIKVKLAPETKKAIGNVTVEARQGYYR